MKDGGIGLWSKKKNTKNSIYIISQRFAKLLAAVVSPCYRAGEMIVLRKFNFLSN